MPQRMLIDSSGLIAFVDRRASANDAIASIIASNANEIIIPASTIPEVSYIIASRMGHGSLRRFIHDLTNSTPRLKIWYPWTIHVLPRS